MAGSVKGTHGTVVGGMGSNLNTGFDDNGVWGTLAQGGEQKAFGKASGAETNKISVVWWVAMLHCCRADSINRLDGGRASQVYCYNSCENVLWTTRSALLIRNNY